MDNTYWNRKGKYQVAATLLHLRIPTEGPVAEPRKNRALEKFRVAQNCYYDLYNNGLCNRSAQFSRIFSIRPAGYKLPWHPYGRFSERLYEKTEAIMDEIIQAAAIEQGLGLSIIDVI